MFCVIAVNGVAIVHQTVPVSRVIVVDRTAMLLQSVATISPTSPRRQCRAKASNNHPPTLPIVEHSNNHPPTLEHKANNNHPPTLEHKANNNHPPTLEHKANNNHPPTLEHKANNNHPPTLPIVEHSNNHPPTLEHKANNNHPPTLEHKANNNHPPTLEHKANNNHPPTLEHKANNNHPPTLEHKASSQHVSATLRAALFQDPLIRDVDLINQAPDLAYLAGPPGTGKTLTAVIMALEWLRQHGIVDILSWDIFSLASAHLIKQQLEETARLILGEQAASRVHLHDNLEQDGAVDRLVATLTARTTSDVCLIADEVEEFGTRQHFRYDNNHNNVLQQHRYNDLKR
nr:hypothetical protein BaRGS_016091 [Batillaria attramentaria]